MNRLKITILLGGLTVLVIAVGYYFGGQNGALGALRRGHQATGRDA